jgi:hypothetical protein
MKHSTMSVFLSEPLDAMKRWQTFVVIVTLVLSQLLVNVWMYYAKSVGCCAEVRALLACPEGAPCRGLEANCADLPLAFAATPVPGYPDGLADWVCRAFPDDDAPRDSLIVGLISIASACCYRIVCLLAHSLTHGRILFNQSHCRSACSSPPASSWPMTAKRLSRF